MIEFISGQNTKRPFEPEYPGRAIDRTSGYFSLILLILPFFSRENQGQNFSYLHSLSWASWPDPNSAAFLFTDIVPNDRYASVVKDGASPVLNFKKVLVQYSTGIPQGTVTHIEHQYSMPLRVPSDSVLSPKRPIAIGNLFWRLPRSPTSSSGLSLIAPNCLSTCSCELWDGLTALHVQADHHDRLLRIHHCQWQMYPTAPIRRMNPDD
jgi:hypothetical protein